MIAIALLGVVASLVGASLAEPLSAQLHVSEHGVEYNQTLKYDQAEDALTIHVPAHLDLDEHTTIMHRPSLTSLTFNYRLSTCELQRLDPDFDPLMTFVDFAKSEASNSTASTDNSELKTFISVDVGLVGPKLRSSLSNSMRELCRDKEIMLIQKVEVSPEEARSDVFVMIDLENNVDEHGRTKRDTPLPSGGSVCHKFHKCYPSGAFSAGQTCDWILCNPLQKADKRCSKMYDHRATFKKKCAVCCFNQGHGSLFCSCSEITTVEKFVSCQAKIKYIH